MGVFIPCVVEVREGETPREVLVWGGQRAMVSSSSRDLARYALSQASRGPDDKRLLKAKVVAFQDVPVSMKAPAQPPTPKP